MLLCLTSSYWSICTFRKQYVLYLRRNDQYDAHDGLLGGVLVLGKWLAFYKGELKGLYVLLSRTQAGPGSAVKQEQEENSRNHIPAFQWISLSVVVTRKSIHRIKNNKAHSALGFGPFWLLVRASPYQLCIVPLNPTLTHNISKNNTFLLSTKYSLSSIISLDKVW